jgi:tetratricopeptide (TPR) repeat protein
MTTLQKVVLGAGSCAVAVGAWYASPILCGALLGMTFCSAAAATAVQRGHAKKRMRQALALEDATVARQALDQLRVDGALPNELAMSEALVYELEGQHREAVRALERLVESGQLGPSEIAYARNNLAWSLAQIGDAERAIAVAEQALAGAPVWLAPYCLGTLGVAQLLAGRIQAAINTLREALGAGDGQARAQSIRAFYLGEALRGLGRFDEAASAYERCMSEAPNLGWATRARGRLGELAAATPYRA